MESEAADGGKCCKDRRFLLWCKAGSRHRCMSRRKRKMGQKIYTYGPIIHNEEVVKDLQESEEWK